MLQNISLMNMQSNKVNFGKMTQKEMNELKPGYSVYSDRNNQAYTVENMGDKTITICPNNLGQANASDDPSITLCRSHIMNNFSRSPIRKNR